MNIVPGPCRCNPASAARFAKSLNRLVSDLRIRLPKEFQAEPFREKVIDIQKKYGQQKKDHFEALDRSALGKHLKVEKTPSGYQTIPMNGEVPYTEEEFAGLTEQERAGLEAIIQAFQEEVQTAMREVNRLNHAQQKEIQQLAEELARFVVKNRLDLIRENYQDQKEILQFLDELQEDMVENVALFLPRQQEPEANAKTPAERYGTRLEPLPDQRPGRPLGHRGGTRGVRAQPHLSKRLRPHREKGRHGHPGHRLFHGSVRIFAAGQRRFSNPGSGLGAGPAPGLGVAQTRSAEQNALHRGHGP
jgi:flagellar biosynthesis/type III secretory pathway protein FliH